MTPARIQLSRWRPMKTAPRDGSPVVLLYSDLSGVVGARFGEVNSDELRDFARGWFCLDWGETVGELCDDLYFADHDVTDKRFAGWVPIPEFPKAKAK